jgi:hypothetical protein
MTTKPKPLTTAQLNLLACCDGHWHVPAGERQRSARTLEGRGYLEGKTVAYNGSRGRPSWRRGYLLTDAGRVAMREAFQKGAAK